MDAEKIIGNGGRGQNETVRDAQREYNTETEGWRRER